MRITDVKVQSIRIPVPPAWVVHFGKTMDVTLVTVFTDEGIEGYAMGRAVGGAPGVILGQEVISVAKSLVMGEDPFDREKIWQRMWNMITRVRLSIFALSCIDVALWDIAGKALGSPVYKLIGAYREKIPAYASSGVHSSVEAYVEEALQSKEKGYRAYKLHPFGVPERDVDACRAVRKAVGEEMALMLDPTGAYDHRQALWVGRRLEELGYFWYEEPIGDYDISGYAELCRALDIPVLAAETLPGSLYSLAEFITRRATDIARGDVYWKGGITGVMKMAHLAEGFGMKMELHHGASPIMDWANLHAVAAIRNGDYLEILIPKEPLDYGLRAYVGIDKDGFANLSPRPGLGVEFDWDFINSHTVFKA